MRPIAEIQPSAARELLGLVFDVDDTLTRGGWIEEPAYRALWRLREAGLMLIAVTGRPLGFAEVLARTWPLDVAVGENGVKVEHAEDMIYPAEGRTGMPMPGKDLIPSKYAHVDTSGLKYTVKSGDQTYDIPLEGEAPK